MLRRTFIAASMGGLSSAATAAAATAVASAGREHAEMELHRGAALAFGTTVSVSVAHADAAQARRAIDAALAAARRVDTLMSIYHPDSQVYRLNRDRSVQAPDPALLAVLNQARALSLLTRGAFDITVQPLWQLCNAAGPAAASTARGPALAVVNWRMVDVSAEQVSLRKSGIGITLNGLAQGYAADLGLAALRAHGIRHALVDMGELAACGAKPGAQPWTVGVADPRVDGAMAARLALGARCLATSGDYASTFTPDMIHHHIFDPATGYSPRELASVSVLAPSAMLADGLSTAFMVMGAKKAHALAARMEQVDLLTINKRGVVWRSPGFPVLA